MQEAWLRLDRAQIDQSAQIKNLQAWLTTTVSRLCLDRLTSAAARRETYVGQWLPEPIVTALDGHDPLATVLAHEENRLAALIVLDVLPPAQRVALVLHDAFGVPFKQIAEALGISEASTRQLASRARKDVADPPPAVSDEEHSDAVGRFLTAMANGDLAAIIATLHPDARYGTGAIDQLVPVLVNGQFGLMTTGFTGETKKQSSPPRVAGFTVRDGLVWATYDFANPDKLGGVRLPDQPQSPKEPGTNLPN